MIKVFQAFPIDSIANPWDWLFEVLIFGVLGVMIAGIIVTLVRRYIRNHRKQA